MHDILAIADDWRSWSGHMRYAAQFAAILDGSLTGVYLSPTPLVPSSVPEPLIAELVEIAADQARLAAASAGAFKSWAANLGAHRAAWYVVTDEFSQVLKCASDWHDFLVVSREPQAFDAELNDIARILLTTRMPCVVIPRAFEHDACLETVAIAWNGSPEALRAVHAALPLLRRARHIILIQQCRTGPPIAKNWAPSIELGSYLAWQDIHLTPELVEVDGDNDPRQIIDAAQASADIVIMGAYGRSRVSEWLLGGATRYALANAKISLFMRH